MWHLGLESGQEDVGAALPRPTAGILRAVLPGTEAPPWGEEDLIYSRVRDISVLLF